jgi:hypothetical protein
MTAKTFCEPAGEQGAHGETGHVGGEDGGERIDGVATTRLRVRSHTTS